MIKYINLFLPVSLFYYLKLKISKVPEAITEVNKV